MGSGAWEMNVWRLIISGGPLMWPILLCSLFALTITIEKILFFRNITSDPVRLKRHIVGLIKNNKIKEAVAYCDDNDSPVAKIYKAGLVKFGTSREEIKESIQDVSLYEIPRLEDRINALAVIGYVTPLLGLLGTVMGMMSSFHAIQVRAASLNPVSPADLAVGVWQALITTAAGLIVSILSLMIYHYLVNRVQYFVLDMERAATDIVNVLSQMTEGRPGETDAV